ncbi:MAG: hypothetical protein AAF648_03680 [Pseudomonadota bacterium]
MRSWAEESGHAYRWLDDELFTPVPVALRLKTRYQSVVTTDLARLLQLERALVEGYSPVFWFDADVLVVAPERFSFTGPGHALGRELWFQATPRGAPKRYWRIHNAFLAFERSDPVLPFYRLAAERVLERFEGQAMVPQLLGPKLLSALGNLAQLTVQEDAAMLPPLVAESLLSADGCLFERWVEEHIVPPAAINLCASLQTDETTGAALVRRLLQRFD